LRGKIEENERIKTPQTNGRKEAGFDTDLRKKEAARATAARHGLGRR
jgi:hypothetical protein